MPNLKSLLFLLVLISFISCQQKQGDGKLKPAQKSEVLKINKVEKTIPDTIYNQITNRVDGHQFRVITTNKDVIFVLNDKKDTIYRDSVYSPNQKFVDFNGDGYKDILIDYVTNTPAIEDVLLYDKAEKTYKKVIDLQDFPASERIANSNYYYSYHRSGCADMNWDSDLFYIKNYKTIKLGNISGNECGDTGIKDGIYITKLVRAKEVKIAKLPIGIIKKYKEYKWGFIAEYWKKNYQKFL